ncbi:MAG: ABC transporter ATP-binding protein [Acidaminococcales bacterium]|jgi:ABC-2 type transport system ATP-binding protein|nr:ABC transporter ATP-binding protein [Acidaminococcales bacterium]
MNVLELAGISKAYGGKTVLDQVGFHVRQGEILGLLGPNGAGKTTLLKAVSGLTKCDRGTIKAFGLDFQDNKRQILKNTGIVPQENNLEREATVKEALLLYAKLFGVRRAKQEVGKLLERFALTEWQDVLVRHLSGGLARKTLIVRALLPDPPLLLLDEPSVGLDPDVRRGIWRLILELKEAGKTIVLTTHYMEEADFLCDRIALLKSGKLIFLDTPGRLKQKSGGATLEDAFIHLTGTGVL